MDNFLWMQEGLWERVQLHEGRDEMFISLQALAAGSSDSSDVVPDVVVVEIDFNFP